MVEGAIGGPRVVLVVPTFPRGSETFIMAKVVGLRDRGWDVHVACGASPEAEWQRFPDHGDDADLRRRVHVVARHEPVWRSALSAPPAIAEAVSANRPAVRRYLRQRGWSAPDKVRRLTLDAHIVALRPDLIHFEFGSLAPERLHLRETCGCPLTTSLRGYDLNDVARDDPGHYAAVWPAMSRIHVLGDYVWRRAQERGCPTGVPHQVINPAVDLARFTPPERTPVDAGGADRPLRVVFVGRADWTKGYEWGLAALAELRGQGVAVEARICGHGAMFEAVAFARHQLGLDDCVELLGAVPRSQVTEALRWADVFVHAAVQEAFGNAVIEAQAMALAVVCTDAGGLRENVEDGVTGLVVARRDPSAIAGALETLVADPERRVAMGAAGRDRAQRCFDLDDHLDRWEGFYREALAVRSSR